MISTFCYSYFVFCTLIVVTLQPIEVFCGLAMPCFIGPVLSYPEKNAPMCTTLSITMPIFFLYLHPSYICRWFICTSKHSQRTPPFRVLYGMDKRSRKSCCFYLFGVCQMRQGKNVTGISLISY